MKDEKEVTGGRKIKLIREIQHANNIFFKVDRRQ